MNPKSIREILNKLIGHDDDVEFGNGYHDECKKEVDEALKQIELLIQEARIEDNHDWDTEMFDPIIVCKRCTATYRTRGNRHCEGKMAKVGFGSSKEKG